MFKKTHLAFAIASAMALPSMVHAEIWASMQLKNETAFFINDGQRTSYAKDMLDSSSGTSKGIYKNEASARVFFNGDIGEDSSWHGELNFIVDPQADSDDYVGHLDYSQHDWLRELYVDTRLGGFDWRLGKQQVVWGTADGIKLLDIINPTDFRELNQNSMEEARIPVWMVNGERNIGSSSNVQLILAQAEENKIPGYTMGRGDSHPFTMLGVDTITGDVNGFYNIAPALSNVAATFQGAAMQGGFTGGNALPTGLNMFAGLTVDGFASGSWDITSPGQLNPGQNPAEPDLSDPTRMPGYVLLNNFAQYGFTGQGLPPGVIDPNGNNNVTNLMPVTGPGFGEVEPWDSFNAPTSAFEWMGNATFATFNTFTGFDPDKPTGLGGIKTQWERDYDSEPNIGGRFRSSLDNGLNFSLNYFYHYSSNPGIDLSWRDNQGKELEVQLASSISPAPGALIPDVSQSLTRAEARANWDEGNPTPVLLHDGTHSTYYGALDPSQIMESIGSGNEIEGAGAPTLRFTEKPHRVHSIGASFDYGVDALDVPLVLRGEFLYDKGEMQPVVDKFLLSIGDLANALKMEEADYFKYVLGADVTVFTNMLASFQFIQFRNLDYVDKSDSCGRQGDPTGSTRIDCSTYTADFATMHITNGLQQAEKNKEFYSFFLSKPFGESQLGRWNNIIIYEEGGGYWDRIDAEYSLTDQVVLTGSLNLYWGEENTTFGQFKDSSNVQVGVKVILE
jgi:hypothetical protein